MCNTHVYLFVIQVSVGGGCEANPKQMPLRNKLNFFEKIELLLTYVLPL